MEKCIPVWFFNDSIQFKSRSEDFGRAGESAVSTELKQLHSQSVIESKHYHELTFKEQIRCPKILMFLKDKHTGQIKREVAQMAESKGSTCRKKKPLHQQYQFNHLFISATFDAHGQRYSRCLHAGQHGRRSPHQT